MNSEAQIRRRRVRKIIDERFDEVDAHFAVRIGKSPTQVARWFMDDPKNGRNIGEKTARHIEKKLGLPKNWLDRDTDEEVPPPPPVEQERWARFSELAQRLTPEQLEEIVTEFDREILAKMERYKQTNEAAVRIFGLKKATTVTAARAASKLPKAPKDGKPIQPKGKRNPSGRLF